MTICWTVLRTKDSYNYVLRIITVTYCQYFSCTVITNHVLLLTRSRYHISFVPFQETRRTEQEVEYIHRWYDSCSSRFSITCTTYVIIYKHSLSSREIWLNTQKSKWLWSNETITMMIVLWGNCGWITKTSAVKPRDNNSFWRLQNTV